MSAIEPCPTPVVLERLADGEPVDDAVRRHVDRCAVCRTWVAEIEKNNRMLLEAGVVERERPSTMRTPATPTAPADRDGPRAAPPGDGTGRTGSVAVVLAVAGLVVLGGVATMWIARSASGPPAAPATAPATADAAIDDGSRPRLEIPAGRGHDGAVRAVASSRSGTRFATGGADGRVCVWAASTGALERTWSDGSAPVSCVAVGVNGRMLAVADASGAVRLHDAREGGGSRVVLENVVDVHCMAFAPDRAELAIGTRDGTIRLVDVDGTGRPHELTGHKATVTALAWTSDGRRLFSASSAGIVRTWDGDGSGALGVLHPRGAAVTCLAVSPNDSVIAIGSVDGAVALRDTARGHLLGAVRTGSRVHAMALLNGGRLVTASAAHIDAWDTARTARVDGAQRAVEAVRASVSGARVVTVDARGGICLW